MENIVDGCCVPVTAEKRMLLRQVPWYSNREWLDVYQGLFEPQGRRAALARIAIWELKSSKVPVAVSATRQLFECVEADEDNHNSGNGLQMMYGTAIVRFVNSYADLVKNKVLGRSIADIWRDLGLPLEVVQVRHAVTHGELPTLDRLRHVAALSLEFLRRTYWDSLAPSMEKAVASVPREDGGGIGPILHQFTVQLSFPYYYLVTSDNIRLQELVFNAVDLIVNKKPRRTIDEEVLRLAEWSSLVKRSLPSAVAALERTLPSLSESVVVSLLEDFLLISIDPLYNVGAVVAVFWILGRSSAGLTSKFISGLISKVIRKDYSKDFDQYCNGSALHLWLNAIDSDRSTSDLSRVPPGVRLLDWLYTLLLIPKDVDIESEAIKLDPTIELLLRILTRNYNSSHLGKRKLSGELMNQERFLQRLATIINLTNSRVLCACRANAHLIARAALDFILPSNDLGSINNNVREESHRLILRLLKAFAASDLRGTITGLASPLFSWLLTRLKSPRLKKTEAAYWAHRMVGNEMPPTSYQLLNEIRALTLSFVDPTWSSRSSNWSCWSPPTSHIEDKRGLKRRSPTTLLSRPVKRGRISPKRKFTFDCDGSISRDGVERVVHFDALKRLETMND